MVLHYFKVASEDMLLTFVSRLPVENGLVSGLWRSDLPQISEKPTTNGTSPPAVPRTGVIPLPCKYNISPYPSCM